MIRVLTLNTWHGHVPKHPLAVLRLEPLGHKEKRTEALLDWMTRLSPDVVMLQECLPQPTYTQFVADALGYDHVSKICNAGVRLFGFGLPAGVGPGEGVSILAKKGLGLRVTGVHRLTGVGFTSRHFSIQFGQLRFALTAEIDFDGRRVALVNTHLRYAYPRIETFEAAWRELRHRGVLHGEPSSFLVGMVRESIRVRDIELGRLAKVVRRLTSLAMPVLVGADFNLDHDHDQMLRFGEELGLLNVLPTVAPSAATWDPEHNPNIEFSTRPHHPDGTPKDAIWSLTAHYDSLRQNPDHLLVGGLLSRGSVRDGGLAMNSGVEGTFPSDHYGIWADVSV